MHMMAHRATRSCHLVLSPTGGWEWRLTSYSRTGQPGPQAREPDVFLHWIRTEISVSLIRGNARIFNRLVDCLIRGTGLHFQKGDDIPALDI